MSLILFLILLAVGLAYLLLKPNKVNPYGQFHARIVAHSKGWLPAHLDLLTFYLVYPRFIHSEMMTHKDFSRSAASSRAIPVHKMLSQVWNSPAMPIEWGINQPGMQAEKTFVGFTRNFLCNLWQLCGRTVCIFVWVAMKVGLHKQVANRMLEPWQLMHVTLTTCKLANFYNLRIHKDAQPEIRHLATLMREMQDSSTPVILAKGDWHLPWISPADHREVFELNIPEPRKIETLKKMSAARCARSSYANFDGERSIFGDLKTYGKLVESAPVHASPCEHQATPDKLVYEPVVDTRTVKADDNRVGFVRQWASWQLHGNLTGYIQFRNTIDGHYLADKA